VGREWVFEQIEQWIRGSKETFFLTGEAGIGKSAVAARLTQVRDDIAAHHFLYHRAQLDHRPRHGPAFNRRPVGKNLVGYGKALANTIKPTYVSVDSRSMSGR